MTTFSPHHTREPDSPARIAVVGAGILGICTALSLKRQGFEVTLFDGQGLAQGCSKGNAGHFATEQVFPLADKRLLLQLPKMMLSPTGPFRINAAYFFKALPWFTRFILNMRHSKALQHTRTLRSLNETALEAYHELLANSQLKHLICKQGSLLLFESTSDKEIQRQFQAYRNQGVAVDLLNPKQVTELEPHLSTRVKAALHFTHVGHTCDPERFAIELAREFQQLGGKFVQQNVTALLPHPSGVQIKYKSGNERYHKAVLAAGVWSKSLLSPLGYKVPLEAERGYHLMIGQRNLLSRPVASAERKFIMTPMASGLRLSGTVEFAGIDADMNEARAAALLPHAKTLLKHLQFQTVDACDKWMGCRPSLPDSLPVIGQAPNHPHLYLAFGHQHLGLTQGAITAKLITELLSGQTPSLDLKPFSLSRFIRAC